MSLKTLFRWHLWLGLISGVFLFLIGLTGSVAVFAEEIDWLVIPPLRVQPTPIESRVDADVLMTQLHTRYPQARVSSLTLSQRPSFAHTANVKVPQPDGRRRSAVVFLDPATGEIRGERRPTGGYTASVYQFIRQSHVRLLMGFWGRVFVGVFGVTLSLSCITGIWIYRGWIKKLFQLKLQGGWRSRKPWAELHKFIGVWSLIFNLLIGLTGAVLGLENLTNKLSQTWFAPAKSVSKKTPEPKPTTLPTPEGEPLGVSALLAHAHRAFPDLKVRTISFPANAANPVVLRGGVPNILVADSHVRSANSIALNSITGETERIVDGRKTNFWRRVYWSFDPLHFGYFGGMLTKIIWFILGLTPGTLAITGAVMWWRRRSRASRPTTPDSRTTAPRWLPPAAVALALTGSYAVLAVHFGNPRITHLFVEHWVVKPVALGLAFFPVTLLLGWAILRFRHHPSKNTGIWLLGSAWYVLLSSLFTP